MKVETLMSEAKDKKTKDRLKDVTPKSEDLSRWYTDVVKKADLADYAPVKGCMIIKPYGYALWEAVQAHLDREFKRTGHVNAYFPLLIPESFLKKEAEHVEGFAPEVAWVTHGGGEALEERLASRPTSEVIIGYMYAKWIQSYRDLPMLYNQWANVMRWEKVTRPFLRTTEFLWQEGHTAHRTEREAEEEVARMLEIYRNFVEGTLAIPLYVGRKTDKEKFAGALYTCTIEAMMPDGQALQSGTSHHLGQNFARAFDIKFTDEDGQLKHVWTTSWGMSTRILGALIMQHGDDFGLVFPPAIAPQQAVVVPIVYDDGGEVVAFARGLAERLAAAGVRVKVDDRDNLKPGWKFAEYEMRGVPLRIEIGKRDMAEGKVTLARRDTREKWQCDAGAVVDEAGRVFASIQKELYDRAKRMMVERTYRVGSLDEMGAAIKDKKGFALAGWCGELACEKRFKEMFSATTRCVAEGEPHERCVVCAGRSAKAVYVGRAY